MLWFLKESFPLLLASCDTRSLSDDLRNLSRIDQGPSPSLLSEPGLCELARFPAYGLLCQTESGRARLGISYLGLPRFQEFQQFGRCFADYDSQGLPTFLKCTANLPWSLAD